MTGNFKKLIESVQGDIILTDALYQWANTPTGTTATDNGKIPKHGLILKNLIVRYGKERADTCFKNFVKIVEDAGFTFESGYHDATLLVNEYLNLNPVLKLQTLYMLASAPAKDQHIVYIYAKFKDQWFQHSLGSYYDDNRENSKKTFKKFSGILKIMFDSEPEPNREDITRALIELGFINELEWITSSNNEFRPYIFSSYLEDIAKNIDRYVNIKGAI